MNSYVLSVNALLNTPVMPDPKWIKESVTSTNDSFSVTINVLGLPVLTCKNPPQNRPAMGIVWEQIARHPSHKARHEAFDLLSKLLAE